MAKERAVDEAIAALWQVIDEAKSFLNDPHSTPNDKKTWAKILGDTIAILNKVSESQKKGEKIEEDDLATLLAKVPESYRKIVRNIFKKSQKAA